MTSKFRNLFCLFYCWEMIFGTSDIRAGRQKRVVGGKLVKDGEFPYQVLILYPFYDDTVEICSGFILSNNLILTAAHCVFNKTTSLFEIYAGDNDRLSVTSSDQIRSAKHIHIHEDFVYDTMVDDMAILQLIKPLEFTDRVKMVTLPRASQEFSGYATATGWGRTEDGQISEILRKIELPIVPDLECKRIYEKTLVTVTDKMICAGGVAGQDICDGASGLLCKQDGRLGKEETVICGVVSKRPSFGCALDVYPGMFTKVSKYICWIENITFEISKREEKGSNDNLDEKDGNPETPTWSNFISGLVIVCVVLGCVVIHCHCPRLALMHFFHNLCKNCKQEQNII